MRMTNDLVACGISMTNDLAALRMTNDERAPDPVIRHSSFVMHAKRSDAC
jgi:hypothetical protein